MVAELVSHFAQLASCEPVDLDKQKIRAVAKTLAEPEMVFAPQAAWPKKIKNDFFDCE